MDYFTVLMTPFILWIISMLVFVSVGHGWATFLFLGLGIGFVLNLMFTRSVISEAYEIKRKLKEERREKEKEERLKERQRLEEEYKRNKQERLRNQQCRNEKVIQLYDLLGIKPTTDIDLIKKAYRRKAKQYHPDRGGDELIFIKIKKAYDSILILINS